MEAKKRFLKNYDLICRLVKQKTYRYGLDYDDTLNYVIEKLSEDNFRRLKQFKGKSKFTTFLYTVVQRLIMDLGRKKKNRQEEQQEIFKKFCMENRTRNPEDDLIEEHRLKKFFSACRELTPVERNAIDLRYYDGLKIETICKRLGMSWYKFNKIIDKLKEQMSGY